jgi:hypothetical protein
MTNLLRSAGFRYFAFTFSAKRFLLFLFAPVLILQTGRDAPWLETKGLLPRFGLESKILALLGFHEERNAMTDTLTQQGI